MSKLLTKAKEIGIQIENATERGIEFAKYLAKEYSKKSKEDTEESEDAIANKAAAERMALRYLEIICHPGYWSEEKITISSKFKEENRGRPCRKLTEKESKDIKYGLSLGRSVAELKKQFNCSTELIESIKAEEIKKGKIKVKECYRSNKPYYKNQGKNQLIKKLILNKPSASFLSISREVKSSPQIVKRAWDEMVENDEINSLLNYDYKFINNRKLTETERLWAYKKLKQGVTVTKVACALKTNYKTVLGLV